MTDKDRENKPNNGLNGADDELESLSSDEKAAFEKIMAEIATATGDDAAAIPISGKPASESSISLNNPTSAGKNTKTDNDPPRAADDQTTSSEMTDTDQQAALESVLNDIKSQQGASTSQIKDNDEETLDDDQQAALDKIMAEIESKQKPDKSSTLIETPAGEPENEELTEDQQAALDKIMSEIGAKDKNNKDMAASLEDSQDPAPQDVSDDQQAALEKIMGEIEARKDKEKEPPQSDAAEDAQDLTDDQEAALQKIMNEIETRKEKNETPGIDKKKIVDETEPTSNPVADDPINDQEAALEKIMREIDAQKEAKAEPVSQLVDNDEISKIIENQQEKTPPENTNLSLDQFSEELTQLLSNQDEKSSSGKESEKPDLKSFDFSEDKPSNNNNLKNVNNALKDIIGEKDSEHKNDKKLDKADHVNYPILKEVDSSREISEPEIKKPKKAKKQKHRQTKPLLRKVLIWSSVALSALVLIGAGYWGYSQYSDNIIQLFTKSHSPAPDEASLPVTPDPQYPAGVPIENHPAPTPLNKSADQPLAPIVPDQPVQRTANQTLSMTDLITELKAARQKLLYKKAEVVELKGYYQKGIEDDQVNIEGYLDKNTPIPFASAIKNSRIELALKSTQRRISYMTKLDTPIMMLEAASEELLFLERRTQLYNILIEHISGFPVLDYQNDVRQIMNDHVQILGQLSVDEIDVAPPSLETVWNQMSDAFYKKQTDATSNAFKDPKDRLISSGICKGNFDQKYLLKTLTPETANCLIKWSGKDMYLNELIELPPEVAKIVSQWPGEWLSLNGLKKLAPESAKYLSQWNGKRLSLNGITNLSAAATAHLSKWQGEHLEMIGLQSLGRWENYGTRLFLSEKLQRQLEGR